MIKRLIKNLRRQPKHTKDKIAMGIAGSFTAAVFAVWLYHMPARISAITLENEKESAPAFSQFFDEISDQLSSTKEAISEKEDSEPTQDIAEFEKSFENWSMPGTGTTSSSTGIMASSSATTTGTAVYRAQPYATTSTNQAPTPEPQAIRLVTASSSASSVGTE